MARNSCYKGEYPSPRPLSRRKKISCCAPELLSIPNLHAKPIKDCRPWHSGQNLRFSWLERCQFLAHKSVNPTSWSLDLSCHATRALVAATPVLAESKVFRLASFQSFSYRSFANRCRQEFHHLEYLVQWGHASNCFLPFSKVIWYLTVYFTNSFLERI